MVSGYVDMLVVLSNIRAVFFDEDVFPFAALLREEVGQGEYVFS